MEMPYASESPAVRELETRGTAGWKPALHREWICFSSIGDKPGRIPAFQETSHSRGSLDNARASWSAPSLWRFGHTHRLGTDASKAL